jgi:hypothetical protein
MVDNAEAKGLIIDPKMKAIVLPQQNVSGAAYVAPFAGGPGHESLAGWWWVAEYLPKRFKDPAANFVTRWMLHTGRHRHVNDGAKIHDSVFERMRLVPTYRPPNLPDQYVVVPERPDPAGNGQVVAAAQETAQSKLFP